MEILIRFLVILPKLFDNILAHVTIIFLDLGSDLHLILRRDGGHLPAFTHQVQHELCDVPPSDGNVLDSAADHVALCTRYDMGHTVARVDDRACECSFGGLGCPRGGKCKYGLYGDIKSLDVERLEEDLSGHFPVFRRVKWGFCLVVIIRSGPD